MQQKNREYSELKHKGGSTHKAQYYDFFFIRLFSNCFTLHRNSLAARAAFLDLRLKRASQLIPFIKCFGTEESIVPYFFSVTEKCFSGFETV